MKILMSVVMMVCFFGGQAVAEVDPCADEVGAGYGLCNAYCVAMNCDDPDNQEALDMACERVAANYLKIVGIDLECDVEPHQVTCPAWTLAELALVGSGGYDICRDSGDEPLGTNIPHCPAGYVAEWYEDEEWAPEGGPGHAHARVLACTHPEWEDLYIVSFIVNLPLADPEVAPISRYMTLSPEQFEACKNDVVAHVACP